MEKSKKQWNNIAADHTFFPFIAVVFLVIIFIGFAPTFYLPEKEMNLSVPVIIHGILFTIWALFFFCQTLLIRSKKFNLHALLGKLSIVFIFFTLASGLVVAINGIEQFGPRDFGAQIQNLSLVVIFVTLALIYRKRSDWHKRFMVFSVYSVISPAVGRMTFIEDPGLFLLIAHLPLILLIIYDIAVMRRLNKATVLGIIITFVFTTCMGIIGNSQWWASQFA